MLNLVRRFDDWYFVETSLWVKFPTISKKVENFVMWLEDWLAG